MKQHQFQEFMQGYAEHFDLLKDIVFETTVRQVNKNTDDTKWRLDLEKVDGRLETVEFEKVVFCHGYQTFKNLPLYPGQDEYTGELLHAQEYRRSKALPLSAC
jgi:dimethylaniline monooxygenase (N-oxide forming)